MQAHWALAWLIPHGSRGSGYAIVAACINAETGVGPSIASGNQVCKPICADFPTAPINRKIRITVNISDSQVARLRECPVKSLAVANTVE